MRLGTVPHALAVERCPIRSSDDPRLAVLYDPLHPDRTDLDVYLAMVDEFGARSVLDVGCGTGTFACMLALRGTEVTAVDPAAASLKVACGKPGADRVRWIHGDATTLPPLKAHAAFMTGNVAQVFLTDADWMAALCGIRQALRPGGLLVFETRDPSREAWRDWNREATFRRVELPDAGVIETRNDVLDVTGELVTFRDTTVFTSDGTVITSDSTLRFRNRAEVDAGLVAAGFRLDEVRDAPDRPGREFVFIAHS